MRVTWIGWLLVPVTLALVALAPRRVYQLMVFFIPFSATAVVNFGSPQTGSGLQAYMFLGSCWIVAEALAVLRHGFLPFPYSGRRSALVLLAFGAIAAASLTMPLIIDGSVSIASADLLSLESTPLRLTGRHLTQALYLAFGIVLTILIAARNGKSDNRMHTMRIYTMAAVFVSVWGWVQWVCYRLGVSYPSAVFNNSITRSARGYEQVIQELGLQRISSVSVEPSILAQSLLAVWPVLLLAIVLRHAVLSSLFDKIAFVLISSVLVISTSASAYIGLAVSSLLAAWTLYRLRILRTGHILGMVVAIFALVIAYASSASLRLWTTELVLSKTSAYSGVERLSSVVTGWRYFKDHPVLGVGWGSVASHDLVVKVLANSGILGFLALALFLGYTAANLRPLGRSLGVPAADQFWRASLLVSFGTLVLLSILTGFNYVFGHVWLVFGLAIASAATMGGTGASPERTVSGRALSGEQ